MKFISKPIALVLLFSAGVFTAKGQEISKSFSGIKKINLSTSAGSCTLVKGSSNDVQVKVSFTYSSDDYRPLMEQEGSTLMLKEDFQNRKSYSGNSSWVLTIPENMDVSFSSGSGNFEAKDMSVKVSANSGSGNYTWVSVKGDSKINTGSGNINIVGHQGNLNVNTGSGKINIGSLEGDLLANAGSGKIGLSKLKGACSVNVGSGDIDARDITLTGKGSFNSGSGDASVTLATSPTHNISVNSGSGDALLDFGGNKIEGKVIMTANKKNGKIVAPFSFDKTEELDNDGNDNVRIRKTAQLGAKDIEIKIGTGSGTAEVKK
jgi:hypothetical protein